MASYVVMEPPAGTGWKSAEDARFVRDGFAFLAFLVPFIWFLWHRMWIEAAAALALTFALGGLSSLEAFADIGPVVSLLVWILIALEANALRVTALERRGWHVWGVVEAHNREEAEMRYLAELATASEKRGFEKPDGAPPAPDRPPHRRPSGPAVGLLAYPGR